MPETPHFEQIAARLLSEVSTSLDGDAYRQAAGRVVEQLRQVWHARGAADCAKLETEWRDGLTLAPVLRAIQQVDR